MVYIGFHHQKNHATYASPFVETPSFALCPLKNFLTVRTLRGISTATPLPLPFPNQVHISDISLEEEEAEMDRHKFF